MGASSRSSSASARVHGSHKADDQTTEEKIHILRQRMAEGRGGERPPRSLGNSGGAARAAFGIGSGAERSSPSPSPPRSAFATHHGGSRRSGDSHYYEHDVEVDAARRELKQKADKLAELQAKLEAQKRSLDKFKRAYAEAIERAEEVNRALKAEQRKNLSIEHELRVTQVNWSAVLTQSLCF